MNHFSQHLTDRTVLVTGDNNPRGIGASFNSGVNHPSSYRSP